MSEDISKIISKYKMYMSFDGNEYEMIQKVELNKIFKEIERLNNKIDKAIEMLEKYGNGTFDEKLLEILKGEE